MKAQELDFERWFDIALNKFTLSGFINLPLDRDAAMDGYNEGLSPEQYISDMVEGWDTDNE